MRASSKHADEGDLIRFGVKQKKAEKLQSIMTPTVLNKTRDDSVPNSDVVSMGTSVEQLACRERIPAGGVEGEKSSMAMEMGVEGEFEEGGVEGGTEMEGVGEGGGFEERRESVGIGGGNGEEGEEEEGEERGGMEEGVDDGVVGEGDGERRRAEEDGDGEGGGVEAGGGGDELGGEGWGVIELGFDHARVDLVEGLQG